MTDTGRVSLIRDILMSNVSPAAMIEAIKPIVGEHVPTVPQPRSKLSVVPAKDTIKAPVDDQQHERFLTLPEICKRAGYSPNTVRTYRAKSLSHRLKLPALTKRGDGRLGCMESTLNKFLLEQYGT